LMFNGHIDTVTLVGYEGNPLSSKIESRRLYGRGTADMKCGVVATMVALANSKSLNLRGDVIFAGVADEEDLSIVRLALAYAWADLLVRGRQHVNRS
jgi:acetylornithine deacetylase/succinyl-diaminopimelate desuccinylase-like protein